MALVATRFPDVRALLGPSWQKVKFQLHAGAPSDYPTGGYPLTASQVELGLISGIDITATNLAGILYSMIPVFPASSFGTPPQPASTVNMVVVTAGAQVANLTDLTALYWVAEVDGW
jgi:hypothetical protein